MKDELNKSDLHKEETIKYKTDNPNVKMAEIAVFGYRGKKLYQPKICTTSGRYVIDRCSYYDIEDAKKCIDIYTDKDIKNV